MSHLGNAGAFLAANAAQLLPPKSDTGTTGTGVDITDYEGLGIVSVHVGAVTAAGILKVTIKDSADNSTFTAVTSFGPNGDGTTANTSVSGNQELSYPLDLSACRRYVRAESSVVSGTSAILGASLNAVKKATG